MTTELYASLLVVCGLLVAVSAIQRYASNFIIPGVTIMMFIGAISVIVPLYNSDIKTVYNSIVNKAPDLILLVLIPPLSGSPPSRNDARVYTHGYGWSCYRIIEGVIETPLYYWCLAAVALADGAAVALDKPNLYY
jgi:hypothetical protein